MSNTPNAGIPYVPENSLDPAAGLNIALNVIDALLQTSVVSMSITAPPGSPQDGDRYIVGSPSTGAWAGQENNLARYVSEGAFWQFYEAGDQVILVLNLDDGALYVFSDTGSGGSSWNPISVAVGGGGDTTSPVVTESGTNLNASPSNSGNYTRFTNAGAKTYTFDDSAGLIAGDEYTARNVGSGDLTIVGTSGMTLRAPFGGGFVVKQGGTVTMKVVDADEVDIIGQASA